LDRPTGSPVPQPDGDHSNARQRRPQVGPAVGRCYRWKVGHRHRAQAGQALLDVPEVLADEHRRVGDLADAMMAEFKRVIAERNRQ
jgi:hypothetical protein